MKATAVIERDHRAAEHMFETYKKANQEDRAAMEEKIFEALDTHERMEDDYFYPALEDALSDDTTLAALKEEQSALKEEVAQVQAISGDRSEALKAAMEKVLAHAQKEERELFPMAEEALGSERLEDLGQKMEPGSAVAAEERKQRSS